MNKRFSIATKVSFSKKKYDSIIFISTIFFIPFLLTLFRPITSTDTGGYFKYYLMAISNKLENFNAEQSYYIISRIAYFLTHNNSGFRIVLFVYQSIAYFTLLLIISKSSKPYLTFLIYFCFAYIYQFSIQIRSSVSNLIFILAVYDILEHNWKKYYLKMIIAYFFHHSSILFFIVYPLSIFILHHKKILYIYPFVLIIFSKYFAVFMDTFLSFMKTSQYPFFMTLYNYTQISRYQDVIINPLNRISLSIIVLYYVPLFKLKIQEITQLECICLVVMGLSLFCYFFGAYNIPIIGQRYPEALNLIYLIYIPLFEKYIKEKYLFYIFIFIYLAIIAKQYSTIESMLSFIGIE